VGQPRFSAMLERSEGASDIRFLSNVFEESPREFLSDSCAFVNAECFSYCLRKAPPVPLGVEPAHFIETDSEFFGLEVRINRSVSTAPE